jgi:hypothetical protein
MLSWQFLTWHWTLDTVQMGHCIHYWKTLVRYDTRTDWTIYCNMICNLIRARLLSHSSFLRMIGTWLVITVTSQWGYNRHFYFPHSIFPRRHRSASELWCVVHYVLPVLRTHFGSSASVVQYSMKNVGDGLGFLGVRFQDSKLSVYLKVKTAHSAAPLGAVTWTLVVAAPILRWRMATDTSTDRKELPWGKIIWLHHQ